MTAVLLLFACATLSYGSDFIITEQSDSSLTTSLDILIADLGNVTSGASFDVFHLEYKHLAERPLHKREAKELYGHLDIHVEESEIKEVPMSVLYDKMVNLSAMASERPQKRLTHLHTLVSLFLKNKGCPINWQVFEVVFYTEDSAFFEYLAIHRPTGAMYLVELGS